MDSCVRTTRRTYRVTYLEKVKKELLDSRLLQPAIVSSQELRPLANVLPNFLTSAEVVDPHSSSLMGRDVILVHAGEKGWEEALELVCSQSPSRLFVIAPELPRIEALKLEWVADRVFVGAETYDYEVHELGLSA